MTRATGRTMAVATRTTAQTAQAMAAFNHERFDGGGYPAGMSGAQIPLSGRIVAVADYFDALTMDRVYRKAFSYETALGMLLEQRGRSFDPQIVEAFFSVIAEND